MSKKTRPPAQHRYRVTARYVETTVLERFIVAESATEARKLITQHVDIESVRGTPRGLVRGTRCVKLQAIQAEKVEGD